MIGGRPAELEASLADRVAELRRADPLAPITVLVGASLQRPFLQRWLAAQARRARERADPDARRPGAAAWRAGACRGTGGGRCRRSLTGCCWPRSRARIRGTSRRSAETPGFAEALYRLVRELKRRGLRPRRSRPLLEARPTRPRRPARWRRSCAAFEQRRARLLRPRRRAARRRSRAARWARAAGVGAAGPAAGARAAARRRRRADAGRRLSCRSAGRRADARSPRSRQRLIAAGRRPCAPAPAAGRGSRRSTGSDAALFTPPAAPGDRARRDGAACVGPDPAREVRAAARACLAVGRGGGRRSGRWRSPTGRATRTGRWSRRCSSRRGSRSTCTRARRWRSARSGRQTLGAARPLRQRPLAPVGDGLPHRRAVPGGAARRVRRQSRRPGGTPSRGKPGSSAAPSSGRSGSRRCRRTCAATTSRRTGRLGARRGSPTPDSSRGSSPTSTRGCTLTPARAPWAEHLDYLRDAARPLRAAAARRSSTRCAGSSGSRRWRRRSSFERFLDVVRRAIETLRSEDVLEGRAGAFARRGVNVVAVNSLRRDRVRAACGSSARPSASFPPPARQDPILLDAERADDLASGRARGSRRARRAGSEEELQFALACEAARERLVVSYARRATGESRPRLPSVFFRELASQLEGERVSAERGAAAAPPRRRADRRRRDRRADPRRPLRRRPPRRSARPPSWRSRPPSATGPTCRRGHRSRPRSPRSSGPRPRSRARSAAERARRSDRYSRVGRRARA